jgi:UDP-GlcNAc:undecaprenyl-phosphate GlcNAc-1-phosphate transferase
MLDKYLLIAIAGFLFGVSFTSFLRRFVLRYNLLISKGIPLVGGVAISLAFILTSFLAIYFCGGAAKKIIGIIIGSILILVFGVIDDWRELSIIAKFLVQIIATTILIIFGIKTQIVYIGPFFNILVTFIWVIWITNAFNFLDIIDGLAATVAIIVSSAFFLVSFLSADIYIAILSLALAMSVSGFLLFNFPPASIYMGNSGSHFLGFVLAAVALIARYAQLERGVALISPLIILGLPIFDSIFLIFMRLAKKIIPFRKSNDHIALRLLRLGYSNRKALGNMCVLCFFFSVCGVIISKSSNSSGIVISALVGLVVFVYAVRISRIYVDG